MPFAGARFCRGRAEAHGFDMELEQAIARGDKRCRRIVIDKAK
jgi:hypothetical protein